MALTGSPWRTRPKKISGTLNSISTSDRSSSVVSTVSSSTRAPMSTPRMPTTPANGAFTVRSASCFRAPSSRARAPSKRRLKLVHGRLRDGIVGAQLRRPVQRQLGLAQRSLRFGHRRLLGLVVDANQDGARLDPLARRERDLGDPARGQWDDVDGLAGQRRADRFDPLPDRSGLGRGERHRHGVRAAPHSRRGLAVGLHPMVDEAAGAERPRDDQGDRELRG